jgi:hypothetical protein
LNKVARKIIPTLIFFLLILAPGLYGISQATTFHIEAYEDDSLVVQKALQHYSELLFKTTGIAIKDTVNVIVAVDPYSFGIAVGGEVPDWGAAVAIKERRLIVVKSPRLFPVGKSLNELIGHELTHIALDEAVGGKWLPRWFEEGFCQMMSGEWRFEQDILLTQAIWGSGLISLIELESLNRFGGAKASLAYAESYLAVTSLARDLGMDFFPDFFTEYRQSGNFYQAFSKTSGYKYYEWINQWQNQTARKYRFVLFVFDSRLFFPMLAVVFLLLYVLKLYQVRRKKKEWERLERIRDNDQSFTT